MRLLPLSLTIVVAGCGGGDPHAPATVDAAVAAVDAAIDAAPRLSVPDAAYLDDLTSAQELDLCTWMVDVQGGPHTVDCGGGTHVTIDPVDSCLENPWPHCQVGLLRTCIEGQVADLCADAPPACTAFYQCAYGGT
jgi:hypothetical protein